jgi:hypothetical protein
MRIRISLLWRYEDFPQYHGPALILDSSIYMVEKDRCQHIRIRNEMYELSQLVGGLAQLMKIIKVFH